MGAPQIASVLAQQYWPMDATLVRTTLSSALRRGELCTTAALRDAWAAYTVQHVAALKTPLAKSSRFVVSWAPRFGAESFLLQETKYELVIPIEIGCTDAVFMP